MLTLDWSQKYFLGGSHSKEVKNQRKKKEKHLYSIWPTPKRDHIPVQVQSQFKFKNRISKELSPFHIPRYQLEIIKSLRQAFILL